MKEKEKVKVIGKLFHFNEAGFWYLFFYNMNNFMVSAMTRGYGQNYVSARCCAVQYDLISIFML